MLNWCRSLLTVSLVWKEVGCNGVFTSSLTYRVRFQKMHVTLLQRFPLFCAPVQHQWLQGEVDMPRRLFHCMSVRNVLVMFFHHTSQHNLLKQRVQYFPLILVFYSIFVQPL